jgi:hypothetical protein
MDEPGCSMSAPASSSASMSSTSSLLAARLGEGGHHPGRVGPVARRVGEQVQRRA